MRAPLAQRRGPRQFPLHGGLILLNRMTRAADPRPDKGATRSRITWGTDVTPIRVRGIAVCLGVTWRSGDREWPAGGGAAGRAEDDRALRLRGLVGTIERPGGCHVNEHKPAQVEKILSGFPAATSRRRLARSGAWCSPARRSRRRSPPRPPSRPQPLAAGRGPASWLSPLNPWLGEGTRPASRCPLPCRHLSRQCLLSDPWRAAEARARAAGDSDAGSHFSRRPRAAARWRGWALLVLLVPQRRVLCWPRPRGRRGRRAPTRVS
jgi:hypothetical protein